jgi:hypothetical protein
VTLVRRRFASAFASLWPSQRFGATRRRDKWQTVPKFKVGNDDLLKKPSKTPTTMLMFNDLT